MKKLFTTITIVFAGMNIHAQTFTPVTTNIINVEASSLDWADYDNDGKTDLAIIGQNSNGCFTKIYHNDGDFVFTDINAGLPGVFDGQSRDAIKWGDYDNDDKPDLLICGNTCNGTSFTKVFHNNGNNSFTDIYAGLPANSSNENFGGSLGWGDFNNDGFLDIVVKGYSSPCNYFSKIYKNNMGNGTFTFMVDLFGTDNGSLEIADYDNDGKLDIVSQGFHACDAYCGSIKLYHNDSNFVFSNPVNFQSALQGDVKWLDYDNDGLKDIIISGRECNTPKLVLYKNNSGNNFSIVLNTFPVGGTSFDAGDVNNDSYKDLYCYGNLWINNVAINFSQSLNSFSTLYNGETKLVDMDNDGDLDLIITGANTGVAHTIVYRNEQISNPLSCLDAYYPFTGNAADSSGNGNNGTVNGVTLTSDRFGNQNKAYSFNGVNNYIEVADSPTLQFSSNQQTVSFWMKIPQIASPVNEVAIIEKIDQHLSIDPTGNSAQGFRINMGPDGSLHYSAKGGNTSPWGYVSINYSLLSVNQYMFIAFTNNGDSAKAYLNGVKIASNKISSGSSIGLNNQSLLIGKERWTSNGATMDYFLGSLDEIRFSDCALSDSGIVDLYNECITPVANINSTDTVGFCPSTSITLHTDTCTSCNYQWLKNNLSVNGATNASYSTSAIGDYKVIVSNSCGTDTSAKVKVVKFPKPNILLATSGPTTFCYGDSVTIFSYSNASPNVAFQWKKANSIIPGAVQSSFNTAIPGKYSVIVTNTVTGCSATSTPVQVISQCPVATLNPSGTVSICSNSVLLNVTVTGSVISGYQWKRNGNNIAGAITSSYNASQPGKYRCMITTNIGCTKLSAVTTVVSSCRDGLLNENDLSVYPSPANNVFEISYNSSAGENTLIEIYNSTGELIQTITDANKMDGNNKIQLSAEELEMKPGLYFIKYFNGSNPKVAKLIVQ